ncbi:DUF3871 family protein (plasmid) [Pedobacter sp. BS3]|uniref:DUF3871 family protein n=1 Tax=Pedobacter sp. BS3 TaxID=2567937 RepID=UPI0011ECB6BD|nr:DUF3871 family protein [Pedobacter sp. BS3]TZF85811.1 DUF3871 family protein [Pedobacter sp. BS3]
MEALPLTVPDTAMNVSSEKAFIQANTSPITLQEIRQKHIIPVFVKDNEPVISHADFIETTIDVVQHLFQHETILSPAIRISHPIKGRIPEAKEKPASQLLESEKTVYYERMAFIVEIPSISDDISGNKLSLTIGGVKSHHQDNLSGKKGSDEHFKLFIGFQNKVCTNLCIWSDGFIADLKVKTSHQLMDGIIHLLVSYNAKQHIDNMRQLSNYYLSEYEFAQLVGRCRMYHYLPNEFKKKLPVFQFGDTQLGILTRDYYKDEAFRQYEDGSIDLWRLYNLLTGVNKSSYIDTFLDRGANAFDFTNKLYQAVSNKEYNWFLHGRK